MKFLFKLFLGLVVLVILLLVAARFAGPPIATRVVNSTLKEKFGETSRFDGMNLSLFKGRVELGELRIAQPDGFGEGFFAAYDSIEADVDVRSLASDTVVVETLRVVNPAFTYRVNAEGLSNIEAAIAAFAPKEKEPTTGEAPKEEPETAGESEPKQLVIRNLEILGVNLDAHSEKGTEPVTVSLEDLNLEIHDFTFDPADPDFGPRILETAVTLTIGAFHASQPGGFEGDTLVGLEGFNLGISVSEARPETLAIETLSLAKPFASLQVNAEGENNILSLIEDLLPASVDLGGSVHEDPATLGAEPAPANPTPAPAKMMKLALDALRIEQAGFELISKVPANPATIRMEELGILLSGVELDPASNHIQIAGIDLRDAAFDIVRLKPAATAAPKEASATMESEGTETATLAESDASTDTTESKSPEGRIALDRFTLTGFSANLRDEVLMKEPLVYRMEPIEASVEGLVFDPASNETEPATVDFRFTLNQGENLQNAEFASLARVSDLHQPIPSIAAVVRFSGFDLAPFRSLLPPGVITALGGSGLDLEADVRVSQELLDGTFAIINNKGNRTSIPIKGTPQKPEISLQSIFAAILGRPLDMAGNVASGAVSAVGEVGAGAADAAKNLGKGAGDTAKKIGGGLMSSVKGLAKGDIGAVTKGVKDATVGAAGEAGKAATGTVEEATQTVSSTASAATGGAMVEEWRKSTPTRHAETVAEAEAWLAAVEFPLSTGAATETTEPTADLESPRAEETDRED